MAYVGTNGTSYNVPVTIGAAETLYAWKNALRQANWILVESGGGTTGSYSSSVDQVDTIAKWNVASAWCRLREPAGGGNRELILMRGSTTTSALIKYSRNTGFNTAPGGGLTGSQCPTTGSTGDGIVWYGVGTDQTAYSSSTPSAQSTVIAQATGYVSFVASDTASANGVYGFWGFSYSAGTAAMFRIFVNESVAPASTIAASPPPGDNDPSWRYITNNMFGYDASQTPQYWQAYGLSGATYITTTLGLPRYIWINSSYQPAVAAWSSQAGLNPYNQQVGMYPALLGAAPPSNPKGFTTGVQMMASLTNLLDTYNITTAEPRIVLQTGFSACSFVVPWVPNASPLY